MEYYEINVLLALNEKIEVYFEKGLHIPNCLYSDGKEFLSQTTNSSESSIRIKQSNSNIYLQNNHNMNNSTESMNQTENITLIDHLDSNIIPQYDQSVMNSSLIVYKCNIPLYQAIFFLSNNHCYPTEILNIQNFHDFNACAGIVQLNGCFWRKLEIIMKNCDELDYNEKENESIIDSLEQNPNQSISIYDYIQNMSNLTKKFTLNDYLITIMTERNAYLINKKIFEKNKFNDDWLINMDLDEKQLIRKSWLKYRTFC